MNTIDVQNRAALITGGSGAIGGAIAKTLASAGSWVGVGYRKYEGRALETIATFGDRARIVKGDVSPAPRNVDVL